HGPYRRPRRRVRSSRADAHSCGDLSSLSGNLAGVLADEPSEQAVAAEALDQDAADGADPLGAGVDLDGLEPGRAAHQLAGHAARLLEQDVHHRADLRGVEGGLLVGDERLEGEKALARHRLVELAVEAGG